MLKVMSQNVMCWEFEEVGNFKNRRPLMKKALTEHGADIIGIQEFTPTWEEFFKEDLTGLEYINKYRKTDNLEGAPIFWNPQRVTALESGWFWLSETPEVESIGWDARCYRITCWVLFEEKETGKRFAFVNTHLDHRGETARQEGIKLVCKFISDKFGSDLPLVLTGDFNAKPDSDTLATANSLLKDAREVAEITDNGNTYHGFGKGESIIDYVFLSESIKCKKYERVIEKKGESIQSDHFGVLATIEI